MSEEPFWSYVQDKAVPDCGVKCVEHLVNICQFDRFTSVRKNALTDRGIGIPPDVNVALQLSGGRMIRTRLYEAGVNLNDQSINQELALRASLTGASATVDVKSASQSVTCGIVWNLLGAQSSRELDWRWYALLNALRTPYTMVEGELHENELFSAMGNGYTFELESLVFYSLAWACTHFLQADTSAVNVYGDDIILPVEAYALLVEVFDFCGFRINENKSFHSTGQNRFRESCGEHYLNGVSVTPFYIDSPLDNPATIILAANNLMRWASMPGYRDGRMLTAWTYLVSHLGPGYLGRRIPMSEANDGLIGDLDECCPSSVSLKGWSGAIPTHIGWKAKTVAFEPRPTDLEDYPRYLRWQYNASGHTGFRPPSVPKLGARRFRTRPFWRMDVEPSLTIAPEVARSIALKASLRLGSRTVSDWPWLGPWVTDDLLVESWEVEYIVRLKSAGVTLTRTPPLARDGKRGRGRKTSPRR
jgi:hypothetical protein